MGDSSIPANVTSLIRHFSDLRDGANDQLPILRAIATSDLHNLVFQADYRIIPAITRASTATLRST